MREINSAPEWAQTIIAAHLAAASAVSERGGGAVDVSHAERLSSRRYFVWQEDGSNDLNADNGHDEQAVNGYTDLFTEVEFDPAVQELGRCFDAAGISWEYTGASWETNTRLFHHSFEWEVL